MSRKCKNAYKPLKDDLNKLDKGAGIIVLDKEDYNKRMLEILNNTTKFMLFGKAELFDLTAITSVSK